MHTIINPLTASKHNEISTEIEIMCSHSQKFGGTQQIEEDFKQIKISDSTSTKSQESKNR